MKKTKNSTKAERVVPKRSSARTRAAEARRARKRFQIVRSEPVGAGPSEDRTPPGGHQPPLADASAMEPMDTQLLNRPDTAGEMTGDNRPAMHRGRKRLTERGA